MLHDECYAVVMAGGAGTRLWPLSSKDTPKHFLKLFAGKSLIELTIGKLKDHIPDDRIIILTSVEYKALALQTLSNIPPENFIYEPCIRDTASAIGLAAAVLQQRCEAATMIMLTADQIIEPAEQFNRAVAHACNFLEAHPEMLIAFGVAAASPSTLVGWQKLGDPLDFPDCEVRKIVAFTEKPALDIAQEFMDDGGYSNPSYRDAGGFNAYGAPLFWNSVDDFGYSDAGFNVHGGGLEGNEAFPVVGVR